MQEKPNNHGSSNILLNLTSLFIDIHKKIKYFKGKAGGGLLASFTFLTYQFTELISFCFEPLPLSKEKHTVYYDFRSTQVMLKG